jgi:PAS domain S-box-containing protein
MAELDDEPGLSGLLLEQAPDALIYADLTGTVRLWNASAERLFGFARSEVLGGSLDVIIPERFREAHWRGFERAIGAGSTQYAGRALTTRAIHKDGRALYVELTFSLPRDAGGKVIGVLAVARDGTERHLSERSRKPR